MWFKNYTPQEINKLCENSMVSHLAIRFVEIDKKSLTAQMPVDKRTIQPMGILHGGASVTLAETIGSVASTLIIDREKFYAVGLEINANHIRSKSEGIVTGIGEPVHIGARTHIWQVRIVDENHKLISISRLTLAVLEK